MAKLKHKELIAMSDDDLKSKLHELRKGIMKEKAQIARGTTLKSPGKLKIMKKDVARILTVISIKDKSKEESKTHKVSDGGKA
jgi:large subunit ribosomal protein L29